MCAGEGRLEKEGVRPLRGGVGAVAHPHVGSIGAGQEQGRGKQWIVGAMHYSQVGSIGAGQEQGRGKQWSAGAMHYPIIRMWAPLVLAKSKAEVSNGERVPCIAHGVVPRCVCR